MTSYLYDGANTVQELVAGSPTANLLTGLGVDELFQRVDASTRTVLADALGSTVALADSAGVVQTSYSYAPYGATTQTGGASANPSKYTGREDDADGLYFYRSRYYHPLFSRFTSEDPIGFGGGDPNLYGYTRASPTNFTDPSGQIVPWLMACAVGAGISVAMDLALSGRKSLNAGGVLSSAAVGCLTSVAGLLGAWKIAAKVIGRMTTAAVEKLAANPGLLRVVLGESRYIAGQTSSGIARLNFGQAVHSMVADAVAANPILSRVLTYSSNNGVDFVGKGLLSGVQIEITTAGQVAAKFAKYGNWLQVITYLRPSGFVPFP